VTANLGRFVASCVGVLRKRCGHESSTKVVLLYHISCLAKRLNGAWKIIFQRML